jgi:hypothetical protein
VILTKVQNFSLLRISEQSKKSLSVLESMNQGRTQYFANTLPPEIQTLVLMRLTPKSSAASNISKVEDEFIVHPIKYLLEMVNSRRGFGVFDPRDMIYAHLGLIGLGGKEINSWASIRPDYTRSVAKVYADFAKPEMERSNKVPWTTLFSTQPIVWWRRT